MITVTNEQLMEELTAIRKLLVKLVSEETKPDVDLNSPEACYYYARDVLKTRFETGEKVIATDVLYSYWYARDVLKTRFEAGEKIIATDARCSYWYARHILKTRFEAGEKAIATNAWCSYQYALNVLKTRFEAGEKVILNSGYKQKYLDFLKVKGIKI